MKRGSQSLALTVAFSALAATAAAGGAADDPGFVDHTEAAGIAFTHVNGAFGDKWMPESIGSGAALFDADGDGWLDLLLIQGTTWPGHEDAVAPELRDATMVLYRNDGDGTFTDVTAASGLDVPMYGFGAAPADYDGDGDLDLYVTAYGANRLFENDGAGRFEDVTARAGVGHEGWGTSAAWFDYDRDGDIDLYAANYVRWSPDNDIWCSIDGQHKSYCTPDSYVGEPSVLYRNEGDGTFVDASRDARVFVPGGKSLGVTVFDVDDDGWQDFAVANDTEPNFLFRNARDGTFEEIGILSGMAFNAEGRARAGMGIDTGDVRNDGGVNLAIGNFSKEMIALFERQPAGVFVDKAGHAGIGRTSFPFLTFALFFFDYDLDGWLDMFATNGHLEERINQVEPGITYAQRALLYRNQGDGRLVDVAADSPALSREVVGRGGAYGDIDGDGDLDVVMTTNDGPAFVFRNTARDGTGAPNVVRLDLRMPGGNTRALGAVVDLGAGEWNQRQVVRSGSSYASQSEFVLTYGLGEQDALSGLRVRWPDGSTLALGAEDLEGAVNHELTVTPDGIVARKPLGRDAS